MSDPAGPHARHRATTSSPRGPLRALVVAVAVLAVVGLAGLTAARLADGGPAAAEPSTPVPSVTSPAPPPATSSTGAAGTQGTGSQPPAPPAGAPLPPATGSGVLPGDPIPGPGTPLAPADGVVPTTLRVPAAGVDVALVSLGLQPDGTIEVPSDPDDAGWLTASAVPGRTGPAVVAGHVDSATGEAVFSRLDELVPGDTVEVALSDGSTVRYAVTGSERYPKDAFPSDDVYGPAPASVLRLITCGGRYDRAAGSYEDNLVVYAVPAP